MSKEDLKENYGKNKKTRALYNAAIREECAGGDETLDTLELISKIRHRSTGETAEARAAFAGWITAGRPTNYTGITGTEEI